MNTRDVQVSDLEYKPVEGRGPGLDVFVGRDKLATLDWERDGSNVRVYLYSKPAFGPAEYNALLLSHLGFKALEEAQKSGAQHRKSSAK